MKAAHLHTVTANLKATIEFHKYRRGLYSNLFRHEFKESGRTLTDSDGLPAAAVNTPIAEFYQKMCEHHAAEVFRAECDLQQWLETAAAELVKIDG